MQERVAGIGHAGQQRIAGSRVLLVGAGALGCQLADMFVRAGVAELLLFDRDVVALDNLARQTLYTEEDATQGRPKAAAAAERLRCIDANVQITAQSSEFDALSAASLPPIDLVLDGTDNFATRFILNDLAVARGVPFLYGGVVGSEGRAQCIVPGRTPCLRCLLPEPPAGFELENCSTAGVLLPAVAAVAAFQAGQGLLWLARDPSASTQLCRGIFHVRRLHRRALHQTGGCAGRSAVPLLRHRRTSGTRRSQPP